MKKTKISIYFADFWPNFNYYDNYFINLLNLKYDVILNSINPDLLIHSVDFSGFENHKKFDNSFTKKIFFTGENVKPNYNISHYSLSFSDNLGQKNYRLPLWILYINWFNKRNKTDSDPSFLIPLKFLTNKRTSNLSLKPFFCSFIASKPIGARMDFIPILNELKKVHCLGRLYSNSFYRAMGRGDEVNKINAMKLFRFNIAFESEQSSGYVTEKILHSFFAKSIPIYWGANEVKKEFNPNSFINISDFESYEHCINTILEIENNKKYLKEYLERPIFNDNKIPVYAKPESVLDFFERIIKN